MQEYTIKSNPKESPIYPYSRTDYYIEIIAGDFLGLHFSFGEINIVDGKIEFDYNLLHIPENVSLNNEIEMIVGEVLQDFIERGYYEFNTK